MWYIGCLTAKDQNCSLSRLLKKKKSQWVGSCYDQFAYEADDCNQWVGIAVALSWNIAAPLTCHQRFIVCG